MTEVPIRPGTITLVQVLKLAGVAMHGGDAHGLIGEGLVFVNGQVETRKRRQLQVGDEIEVRIPGSKSKLKLVEGTNPA